MAAFDTSRTTYGVASFANRTALLISDLITSAISWNDSRITRKALAGLTDRELADIGLERGAIEDVARSVFIR
ncbi:DUF1127 domain-containing protein [uncultured Sulfitobacter sp.]|uniref:DUF1127 domain-containing protein n=1 Tax=uncultured Sulfitobacter sp. TaxID=191468 RepID=UPI00263A1CF8|nr:DUF1127 domain-containing protein [uncultured Sulfitobacter sp.]